MNIKYLILPGQLKRNEFYDFDYDNQIIAHEKFDAKKTYKMNTGYFPGIATIGDKVVYVENRDGNANVKLEQAKTLENGYKLLNETKIYVNLYRMDAGSYSKLLSITISAEGVKKRSIFKTTISAGTIYPVMGHASQHRIPDYDRHAQEFLQSYRP